MSDTASIDHVLSTAVERGDAVGVVAAAATTRDTIYEGAFGRREAGKPDVMTVDSVFWIASMTKAIVSAAAMQMVEQGKVTLEQDLGAILPALANPQVLDGWDGPAKPRLRPARTPISLLHLLTHTAGFSYDMWNAEIGRYMREMDVPGIITCQHKALTTPLIADPGTRWEYGINIDFAGKLVEVLSGQTLDAYLRDHILQPLGMSETGFRIRPEQRGRLVGMHARLPDDSLTPIPFEIPQEPEFHMGGGGLYSVARDYLAFCRMVLNSGNLNGAQVLRPETVELMSRNHIGDIDVTKLVTVETASSNDAEFFPGMMKKWGLGFMINTEAVPTRRGAGSLTWAGLGNTYFWIDPTAKIAGVIMTQSLPFADPAVLGMYDAFETEVYASTTQHKAA